MLSKLMRQRSKRQVNVFHADIFKSESSGYVKGFIETLVIIFFPEIIRKLLLRQRKATE